MSLDAWRAWTAGRGDQEVVDAMARASRDLAVLARLRRSERVRRRDGEYETRHPEVARSFVALVEGLAFPERARAAATIRPNPKRAKKKRR